MTEQPTPVEIDRLVAEKEGLHIRLIWLVAGLACMQDRTHGATEAFINAVRPNPPYRWKTGAPVCTIEEDND